MTTKQNLKKTIKDSINKYHMMLQKFITWAAAYSPKINPINDKVIDSDEKKIKRMCSIFGIV